MRADCKHHETRIYPSGDTVRRCGLDLAPEAPWRCPDDCPGYERRLADRNWSHGSLITPPTPPEPASLKEDPDAVAALLDAAEDIVNAAGPDIVAELDAGRADGGSRRRRLGDLFRRRRDR